MSKPSVIYWAPAETLIANEQDVAENGRFQLITNVGDYSGAFQYDSVIRSITIESAGSSVGRRFLINGIGIIPDSSGNPTTVLGPLEEIREGDGDGIVESENLYSKVNYVQVLDDDIDDCSIYYGTFGITQYIFTDYNKSTVQALSTSYSLEFTNPSEGMTAAVYISLTPPETPTNSGGLQPYAFLGFEVSAPTNVNTIGTIDHGCAVIWAYVEDTGDESSVKFTVLQQGAR